MGGEFGGVAGESGEVVPVPRASMEETFTTIEAQRAAPGFAVHAAAEAAFE